jgi:hypothetical protein
MNVFFARSFGRELYWAYARLTCSSRVWMLVGSKPWSLKVSRSSFVKAEPLLKYGVWSSEMPCIESVYGEHAVGSLHLRTVKLVFCGPEVERSRCPNFVCFESDDILKIRRAPRSATRMKNRGVAVLTWTTRGRCDGSTNYEQLKG